MELSKLAKPPLQFINASELSCILNEIDILQIECENLPNVGSVNICNTYLNELKHILNLNISIPPTSVNQYITQQIILQKTKLNFQLEKRYLTPKICEFILQIDHLTATVVDYTESNKYNNDDDLNNNDDDLNNNDDDLNNNDDDLNNNLGEFYFNWKYVIGTKNNMFIYQYGVEEFLLKYKNIFSSKVDWRIRKNKIL